MLRLISCCWSALLGSLGTRRLHKSILTIRMWRPPLKTPTWRLYQHIFLTRSGWSWSRVEATISVSGKGLIPGKRRRSQEGTLKLVKALIWHMRGMITGITARYGVLSHWLDTLRTSLRKTLRTLVIVVAFRLSRNSPNWILFVVLRSNYSCWCMWFGRENQVGRWDQQRILQTLKLSYSICVDRLAGMYYTSIHTLVWFGEIMSPVNPICVCWTRRIDVEVARKGRFTGFSSHLQVMILSSLRCTNSSDWNRFSSLSIESISFDSWPVTDSKLIIRIWPFALGSSDPWVTFVYFE